MYEPYVNVEEYTGTVIPAVEKERFLRIASRNIDTITFNRIVGIGFSNLTAFQQEIIREAVMRLAEFEYQNRDDLNSVVGGYNINGVSVNYGNAPSMMQISGITMPSEIYNLVMQTGLCLRIVR